MQKKAPKTGSKESNVNTEQIIFLVLAPMFSGFGVILILAGCMMFLHGIGAL